jgi:Xaa-Pro aminopeptidase
MTEVYHERLKSPIPRSELDRRTAEIQKAMKEANIDCILAQNISQYLGGCNRYITDTTAEINYPQSSILPSEGEVRYIACSGPPLDLYPPSHLLRIGKPLAAAPYFSTFNYTNDWEGIMFVKWAKENNVKRIGVPGFEMLNWNYYDYIVKNMPNVEIIDVSSMFDEIRAVKSKDEIKFLRKSAQVLDKVMAYVPAIAQPGVKEYEIRSKLMQLVADLGGDEMIVTMGSVSEDEKLVLYPSFFQNRTLKLGDKLYIKLECSGPGAMFTTLGRAFSIGCEPSDEMLKELEEVLKAQKILVGLLKVEANPKEIYNKYNEYLKENGYEVETSNFAYGLGYDHIERPSIQSEETMALKDNMCMAVNTSTLSEEKAMFLADTFLLTSEGPEKLTNTKQIIFRT